MVNLYEANQRKGINMVRKPVRKLRNASAERVISREGEGTR